MGPYQYRLANKAQLVQKTHNIFKLVSEVSEKKRFRRNELLNRNREFKDINMGDRVYIKKINPSKLESRYYGPCRAVGQRGSIIWAKDLVKPDKILQIHMDRIKLEKYVTIDDSRTIGDVFPSDKPVEPEILEGIKQKNSDAEEILEPENDITMTNAEPSILKDQGAAETEISHRYPLRNRLKKGN